MIATIDKRIRRFLGRIRLPFRGVGTRVDSDGPVQLFQGEALAGEQLQDNEIMQHYGLTTRPPPGFMYVCVPVGGKTAHSIAVATEHGSYRLKGLKSGEVALYSDEGDSIVLKRGNLIEVTTKTFRINAETAIELNAPTITGNASASVEFNTPVVHASQDIRAAEEVFDHTNKSMYDMRYAYNLHTHDENDAGGPTDQPNTGM